jgi:hypothetical protein
MVLTPAPARTMSDSAPASIIASVTWVDRTTSTGAPVFLIAAISVSPGLGLENDVAACRLQRIETGLLELVCNEYLHLLSLSFGCRLNHV